MAPTPPKNRNGKNVKKTANNAETAISRQWIRLVDKASAKYKIPNRHGVSFSEVAAPSATAAAIRLFASVDL